MNILEELGMSSREEVIVFLKRLWTEVPTNCPKCGETLEFLHKKAKKNNCDWICPSCKTIYKTLNILDELNKW